MTEDELKSQLTALQADVNRLAAPYEDALSNRVYEGAKKILYKYTAGVLGIILTVASVAGFKVNDIISNWETTTKTTLEAHTDQLKIQLETDAKKAVANQTEKLKSKLETDANAQLAKLIPELKEKAKQTFDDKMQPLIDQQVASITKDIQKQADIKLNAVLAKIGTRLNDKNFAQKTEKSINELTNKSNSEGWSFFGSKDENGNWKNTTFSISKDKEHSEPKEGDEIEASTNVFLRENPASYDATKGQWSYPVFKTVISPKESVKVQEVKSIETGKGKSIWVRIIRNNLKE